MPDECPIFKSLFRHHNQSFGGADDHAGGNFTVGAEIAADHHGTTVNDCPAQRIERTRHQTAPARHAILQAVVHDAGFGVFFDVAHDTGVHAFGFVAVTADELDFVTLEQIAADGDS